MSDSVYGKELLAGRDAATIDLAEIALDIDSGDVRLFVRGDLGFEEGDDSASVPVRFLDGEGVSLQEEVLGPITREESERRARRDGQPRPGHTHLQVVVRLPRGARSVVVGPPIGPVADLELLLRTDSWRRRMPMHGNDRDRGWGVSRVDAEP